MNKCPLTCPYLKLGAKAYYCKKFDRIITEESSGFPVCLARCDEEREKK